MRAAHTKTPLSVSQHSSRENNPHQHLAQHPPAEHRQEQVTRHSRLASPSTATIRANPTRTPLENPQCGNHESSPHQNPTERLSAQQPREQFAPEPRSGPVSAAIIRTTRTTVPHGPPQRGCGNSTPNHRAGTACPCVTPARPHRRCARHGCRRRHRARRATHRG